jgi:hypothetical protein
LKDASSDRIFYFSGDFATGDISYCTSQLLGYSKLKGLLYSDKPDDTRRFFWLYYKPLINTILTDYYKSMKSK